MWQPSRRWSCPVIWQRITMRWASQQAAAWLEWFMQDWYPWFHVSVGTRSACHSWGCERLEECTADRSKGNGRAVRNSMEVGIVFTFCAWDGLLTKKLLLSSCHLPFFHILLWAFWYWILDVESAQAAIRAMAKRVQGTEASRQTYTELKAEDFAAARNLLGVFEITELRHKFWSSDRAVEAIWSTRTNNFSDCYFSCFYHLLSLLCSSGAVSSSSPSLCLRL